MRVPRTTVVRAELLPSRSRVSPTRATYFAARSGASGVRPSGLCELACNGLPEPLRSVCKAAC